MNNKKITVEQMNLSIKTKNALHLNRIFDSDDILSYSPKKLANLYHLGKKGYADIVKQLEQEGFDVTCYKNYINCFRKNIINIYPYPKNLVYTIFSEDVVLNENIEANVGKILKTLPKHYVKIITLRYKDKKTFNECARLLKCSATAVQKTHKKAIEMLKDPHRSKFLLYKDLEVPVKNQYATDLILSLPIIDLGLDKLTEDVLFQQGIDTLEDLIKDFNSIKLGEKTRERLFNIIKKYGFDI